MNVRQRHYVLLSLLALLLVAAALLTTAAEAQQQNERLASQVQTTKSTAQGFSVRREDERWSLVSPQGKPFFSLGVCCLFQGPSRDEYDSENPSYARWRYYDSPAAWADGSLRRLKSWGFTTVGGWSDYDVLCRSDEMPTGFTPVLHLGATAGAPWWDMWDEKIVARMEEVARKQIVALRDPDFRMPSSTLDGVPPAPNDPFASFDSNTAIKHWDRQRGFVPPMSELPIADLYVCWSPTALYLGLYGWDAIDEHFYASGHVPKVDRAVWAVEAIVQTARSPVRITLGAGREPLINDPKIRVESLSGTKHAVRLIAIVELPAARFGKDRFAAGDIVAVSSTLTTHARAYRVDWKGSFKLAE